jgi:hypothetical protein
MKITSNGRLHQDIKNGISQQLLVRYFSNFKFKLRGPNQNIQWPRIIKYRMLVRGKSEENLEVISSVALLSPACFLF